jgi:hypothetical protein
MPCSNLQLIFPRAAAEVAGNDVDFLPGKNESITASICAPHCQPSSTVGCMSVFNQPEKQPLPYISHSL